MESELTTAVINDDSSKNFLLEEVFNNFKVKEYKTKIVYGIILLLFLGLLIILFCKTYNKESSENEKEQVQKEDETVQNKGYLNLPNDPEFTKFSDIFPFSLKLNENGAIDLEHSCLDNTPPSKLLYSKEDIYQFKKVEIDEQSSNSDNIDFSVAGNFKFILHCDIKYKSKVEEAKNESETFLYIIIKKILSSLSLKRSDIQINDSFKKKLKI